MYGFSLDFADISKKNKKNEKNKKQKKEQAEDILVRLTAKKTPKNYFVSIISF